MTRAYHRWRQSAAALGCFAIVGCSDLTGRRVLPPGAIDPGSVRNAQGAMAVYRGVVLLSASAFLDASLAGGLMTDELHAYDYGGPPLAYGVVGVNATGAFALDARQVAGEAPVTPAGDASVGQIATVYGKLQNVRAQAAQGIGFLRTYVPTDSARRGQLYALAGYAELFLADLFCSGVPLSTLDYDGDYTYRVGSRTTDVYAHAAALFDTAMALAADSIAVRDFARMGKARALLAAGQWLAADSAAQPIPDDFRWSYDVNWGMAFQPATTGRTTLFQVELFGVTVADRKGIVGLPYRSSGDPRTAAPDIIVATIDHSNDDPPGPPQLVYETNAFGQPVSFPAKYGAPTGVAPFVLADGIEARLIHAEALLRTGSTDAAIEQLNALRSSYLPAGTTPGIPTGLTAIQAQDTLFAERAAWLFVTGHRQGDLRRRLRQYSERTAAQLYPVGIYGAYYTNYGNDVTLPIPDAERVNPAFTGCMDRGA